MMWWSLEWLFLKKVFTNWMHDHKRNRAVQHPDSLYDLWSLIETSNNSRFINIKWSLIAFFLNKLLRKVSRPAFLMAYTCGSDVFFYSVTYCYISVCPVTFCIPVHWHVCGLYSHWNFKARFEGTIYSVDYKPEFQYLNRMWISYNLKLVLFRCLDKMIAWLFFS